ncbi:hypothetical protein E5288_WYG020479 [Bos mutus]|uniref:Uncharacterized protein n=1 Tax=Bos mutus TaxID=72004 RepID=A0A6B0S2Q0_9CETA|nr:hypothetical protein [Bos mutus]
MDPDMDEGRVKVMNTATQAPSHVTSFLNDSTEDELCSDSRGLRSQAEVRVLGNGQREEIRGCGCARMLPSNFPKPLIKFLFMWLDAMLLQELLSCSISEACEWLLNVLVPLPTPARHRGGELPVVRQRGRGSNPAGSCTIFIGESPLPAFSERWQKEDAGNLAQCFSWPE